MSAAVQQQEVPKKSVKTKERLTGFGLVEATAFCGKAITSVTIPREADSVVPARLEPDGSAVAITSGQRADGLLLRKRNINLGTRVECVEQKFIPFANITGVDYGE